MSSKRLFLTGATGLLGRAIHSIFLNEGWTVYAVGFSRVKDGIHKLDIMDEKAVSEAIESFKPSVVIHSAALRFPDIVDQQPDLAASVNVDSTKFLARAAVSAGCRVIYISTDYVFDGTSPPYSIDDKPNPLNLYGKTKLQGEQVILDANSENIVLRIPVLYGPVEKLSESAVTVLFEVLKNTSEIKAVSNYELRRPSHVDDIAFICFQLTTATVKGDENVKGIYQWCGSEELTKFSMIVRMSKIFGISYEHIKPVDGPDTGSCSRPYDTTMDRTRLSDLGFGRHTAFDTGIKEVLTQWIEK